MSITETWKPVPGFPSYFASDRGRIGSSKQLSPLATHIRVLKFILTRNLHQYKLRVDNRYVTITGQRLVALAYHENVNNYLYAARIDKSSFSDAPDNVKWVKCNRE